MDKPVISVIVPIYKVEPYLRKCLDSIACQTYRELEIILVDDGSPDNCGKICDEYAAKDNRIKVIHKANGGVSSARNAGLDNVGDSDWIMWVDPDDWIEPDMVEYLLGKAEEYGVDVVGCGGYAERVNGQTPWRFPKEEILEGMPVIENLIKGNLFWGLVGKLWRRELYCGQKFPEDQSVGEDLTVEYSILKKIQKILCLPEAKYHILQREGSISHTPTLKKILDWQRTTMECCEDARSIWPEIDLPIPEADYIVNAVTVWHHYYTYSRNERVLYWPLIKHLSAYAKAHPDVRRAMQRQLGITGRAVLPLLPYATWWSFAIAGFWGWLYRVKKSRMDAKTVVPLPRGQ